jgi:hypothetical protein
MSCPNNLYNTMDAGRLQLCVRNIIQIPPPPSYTQHISYIAPLLKPPIPSNPHLASLPTIQLRPNIQVKVQPSAVLLRLLPPTCIKINNIFNLLPAPIHNPIMPIKRRLIPHPTLPPCPRRQTRTQTRETREFRPAASIRPAGLPALYFVPCALVDGVVDGHNGAHVGGFGVEGFAPHGVEEHLLRRVDPISGFLVGARVALVVGGCGVWECGGARDGADFAVGGEFELGEYGG